MFIKEPNIPLFSLVMSVSSAADMISRKLANHQKRVAYIAEALGRFMGLTKPDRHELLMAGALHDIGALSLKERLDALQFEAQNTSVHSEAGYLLLNSFGPFGELARLVRHHHVWWSDAQQSTERIPFRSHILHLADRVDVLIDFNRHILYQVEEINIVLRSGSGRMFHPEVVEAFEALSQRESFWLDLVCLSDDDLSRAASQVAPIVLDMDRLSEWAQMLSHLIDFRSRFTAVHSSGVAVVAEELAKLLGVSSQEAKMMKVAGFLHDFGKLAVPPEILDKPGPLDPDELAIVKSHAYYSSFLLRRVPELGEINYWISYHHERLDGEGYPFRVGANELPLGAKIIAVADVFTAITEDRPYRDGMSANKALEVLVKMVDEGGLDREIVDRLLRNFDQVNRLRIQAQDQALNEYKIFEGALESTHRAA